MLQLFEIHSLLEKQIFPFFLSEEVLLQGLLEFPVVVIVVEMKIYCHCYNNKYNSNKILINWHDNNNKNYIRIVIYQIYKTITTTTTTT